MGAQLTGRFNGTSSGMVVMELDDLGSTFAGNAQLFDDSNSLPLSVGVLLNFPKSGKFSQTVSVMHLDRLTQAILSHASLQQQFPGLSFPDTAKVDGQWLATGVKVKWLTSVGSVGSAFLKRSRAGKKSEYKPVRGVSNWESFKKFVSTLDRDRYIFRGQPVTARLRTAFHRTGRADLGRYINYDIPLLQRHITAASGHVFDLSRFGETGALYSLAQHHGYPTPLLDWTYSPYIAAFFAFSTANAHNLSDNKVRVFVFDNKSWRADVSPQLDRVAWVMPHFSTIDLMAIGNPRLIPQQALSTLTNVDDIESHIKRIELQSNKSYLRVIDLSIGSRVAALQDLSMMGITAGSLMPGLDGICQDLKNRMFGF
jgi:hypothetical protein